MFARHWPAIALLGVMFAVPAAPALAVTCIGQSAPLKFCKRCTTEVWLATNKDTACGSSFPTAPPQAPQVAVMASKVAKQAANGRVGMQGTTWTYTPKKGFSGRDTFTIERSIIKDNELFVIFLQVYMDVKP